MFVALSLYSRQLLPETPSVRNMTSITIVYSFIWRLDQRPAIAKHPPTASVIIINVKKQSLYTSVIDSHIEKQQKLEL